MANLTVRHIPEDVLEKIRALSLIGKRSLNNEILVVLEKGLRDTLGTLAGQSLSPSIDVQISLWKKLSGKWVDLRSTNEIKRDIYDSRSLGRDVSL